MEITLSGAQKAAVLSDNITVLYGPAGTGKTTALQHRLLRLLEDGEPSYTIMVLVAEPSQRDHFTNFVHTAGTGAGIADLKVTNYVGMAREMVTMFWPLVARQAGFEHAYTPPTWLTYDLAQMLMWDVITPMLDQGHFADLRLRPQQIVSQLLDNLNRSALNGRSLEDAMRRQIESWGGEAEHIRHLRDARRAANEFRNICYASNLLDLSLVVDVFDRFVVNHPEFARYFSERYRHLIVDNIEEQTAAGQHFVRSLMSETQTTTLAFDTGGGYKRFLAANPDLAEQFINLGQHQIAFDQSYIDTQGVYHLARRIDRYLFGSEHVDLRGPAAEVDEVAAEDAILDIVNGRYRREMLLRLGPILAELIEVEGVPPSEIAIIVPYLDGALRYKLTQSLTQAGVPYQLARRRASPREEPRVRAWLTWLAIAHPDWQIYPSMYDVTEALALSIQELDPARAALLAQSLYQPSMPSFRDTAELSAEQLDRIGVEAVARVDELIEWLSDNGSLSGETQPVDLFLHKLFNDLLSQRHFAPVPDTQAAAVCDWLIRLASRLQQSAQAMRLDTPVAIGRAFINGIQNGLVTANPPDLGDPPDPNGVFISTIYGFLLSERTATVQVWLETAATGWWDIPRQPLSNAFVLAEGWQENARWTLEDDVRVRNEMLSRVAVGLTSRCRRGVVLATSELDRRGVRQDGPLWRALQS